MAIGAATLGALGTLAACADDGPTSAAPAAPSASLTPSALTATAATAHTRFVDPAAGSDANDGSAARPFKTLTKALALAQAKDTVRLAAGSYGPLDSGDPFPAAGTTVRSGVTILGAVDAGGNPTALLLGPFGAAAGLGLKLLGDAAVRDVEIASFPVGVYARTGTQALTNVAIQPLGRGTHVVIDGVAEQGGVVLRGTARTTLTHGTVAMRGGFFSPAFGMTGVHVGDQARFTWSGGTIDGGAPNCGKDNVGIRAEEAAQVTTLNLVATNASSTLVMKNATRATLTKTQTTRETPNGCEPSPSMILRGAADLALSSSRVDGRGGKNAVGIEANNHATLTLTGSADTGHTGSGIHCDTDSTRLTVSGSSVSANGVGILARGKLPAITITGSSLVANTEGIRTDAPILRIRNTRVSHNATGIDIRGEVGYVFCVPGVPAGCADLGTVNDPDNNIFSGNTSTGIFLENDVSSGAAVQAVGNVWNGGTQGSTIDGRYPQRLQVNGLSPFAKGLNFIIQRSGYVISL